MPSFANIRPWLLPIGMIAGLAVILIPLPAAVMDVLLAGNIALAVVILLTTLHVKSPLEFSVFPTVLLVTTLSRLVLNIATTRLILTDAPVSGENAAGGVIRTFGQFVAGNQIEVGVVIFAILVVVQFVVITNGSTRISEVAARFALDGMPGKQAAIDADLNAGHLEPEVASQRRESLVVEADFYSAMDGAGKFVRGDAIAGLIITVINVVVGLYLGVFVGGMELTRALDVFTKLTIGDGLVSQLPALLIALSAGVLVTRPAKQTVLGDDIVLQLMGNSRVLYIAGGFLFLLIISGLPAVPLLLLGSGCVAIGVLLQTQSGGLEDHETPEADAESAAEATPQKRVEDFLTVDPLEVAIGLGLLPLADPSRGGDLMQRIASLRNQMAAEIGIVLPKVRVRDDATLGDQEYEIRLYGNFVTRRELRSDRLLAIDDGKTTGTIAGEPATDFAADIAVGGSAKWIEPKDREQALIFGYTTRTAPGALADHLEQIARSHADELLSRDATKHLLDELKQIAPAMVSELIPAVMSVADVQKVLQGLLREAIPIRQLGIILEALSDAALQGGDTESHIEIVRHRLSRTLCASLRDDLRTLHVVTLDQHTTRQVIDEVADMAKLSDITCDVIRRAVKNLTDQGFPPVLLVSPENRRRVKLATINSGLGIHVLATSEISSDTHVEIHVTATTNNQTAAA